jgi:hypothetical protein
MEHSDLVLYIYSHCFYWERLTKDATIVERFDPECGISRDCGILIERFDKESWKCVGNAEWDGVFTIVQGHMSGLRRYELGEIIEDMCHEQKCNILGVNKMDNDKWNDTKGNNYIEDIPVGEYGNPCTHPEHNPPNFICIPHGKRLVHKCPKCGKVTIVYGSTVCY